MTSTQTGLDSRSSHDSASSSNPDADPATIRRHFASTMLVALVIRAAIFGVGLLSIQLAPTDSVPAFNSQHPWLAWDARHYYDVATEGYPSDRSSESFYRIAYFPLFPLASRAISSFVSIDIAMLAISNICSVIGLGFVYDWARRVGGRRLAGLAVLLAATFPGAVSFSSGMTEGPFFMFVAVTIWLLHARFWYLAAIAAGVASATRPTGVALAAAVMAYAWWQLPRSPLSARAIKVAVLGAISLSGITAYEAFLWHRYQSVNAYSEAQQQWRRWDESRLQWNAQEGVVRYSGRFFLTSLLRPQAWNRVIGVAVVAIAVLGLVRKTIVPRPLLLLPLFIFLMTTIPDRGMRVSSLSRYESVAAPIFLLIASWLASARRPWWAVAILVAQFGAQLYYAFLFPREIWVG